MGRSRTAVRRRSSIKKVSVRPKNRTVPKPKVFQHSALEYDHKATQYDNYAQLGLLYDANQIGVVRDKITGFKPRVKVPESKVPTGSDAPHQLEIEMPEGLKTVRKVPEGERSVLLKLMAKHGDDYAAMARDMRLNQYQHTAAHLKRRIAKMHEEDAEDAATAAEAAEAGRAEPPPRLRKKITKDPNPAFKKSSRHFN
jgi:nucleolar protein 16